MQKTPQTPFPLPHGSPTNWQLERELSFQTQSWRDLMSIFWGILFGKCLLLQWAVIAYKAPIQMFLYVWVPTFTFASLASIIYIGSRDKPISEIFATNRLTPLLWLISGVLIAFLAFYSIYLGGFDPYLLPGICSFFLAAIYVAEYSSQKYKVNVLSIVGFFITSIITLWLTDVATLVWLAGALLVFHVIPQSVLYWKARKQFMLGN